VAVAGLQREGGDLGGVARGNLEDAALTTSERSLLKLGEHERLRDLRMLFQHAAERQFCETVERLTGRAVRSFSSGFDSQEDGLSVEFFVLYPIGYQGPSRGRPEAA